MDDRWIEEPARRTPIVREADVLIAGGGLAGIGAARTAPLSQAKIDELQCARLGKESIGRLNVSMDDPMAMCVAEPRGQLQGVV